MLQTSVGSEREADYRLQIWGTYSGALYERRSHSRPNRTGNVLIRIISDEKALSHRVTMAPPVPSAVTRWW